MECKIASQIPTHRTCRLTRAPWERGFCPPTCELVAASKRARKQSKGLNEHFQENFNRVRVTSQFRVRSRVKIAPRRLTDHRDGTRNSREPSFAKKVEECRYTNVLALYQVNVKVKASPNKVAE